MCLTQVFKINFKSFIYQHIMGQHIYRLSDQSDISSDSQSIGNDTSIYNRKEHLLKII